MKQNQVCFFSKSALMEQFYYGSKDRKERDHHEEQNQTFQAF